MFTFQFESIYRAEAEYMVYGDGAPYRIRHRVRPPEEYDRQGYNGTPEEFEKQVTAFTHGVTRWPCEELTPEVYNAFCAYLQSEHERALVAIRAMYDRYAAPEGERDYPQPPVLPVPMQFDLTRRTWVVVSWYQLQEVAA